MPSAKSTLSIQWQEAHSRAHAHAKIFTDKIGRLFFLVLDRVMNNFCVVCKRGSEEKENKPIFGSKFHEPSSIDLVNLRSDLAREGRPTALNNPGVQRVCVCFSSELRRRHNSPESEK